MGPVEMKRQLVDTKEDLSIRRQCELLQFSRGSFYYRAKGENSDNLEMMRLMDAHILEEPTAGVLTMQLNNYGAHLTSLNGLGALTSVGANLIITSNIFLSDCCSIEALLANAGVSGSTIIYGNAFGCQNIVAINTVCGGGNLIAPPNTGYTVAQNIYKEKSILLFPNPATEILNMEISGEYQSGRLRVFDGTGRLILQNEMEESTRLLTLDVSNWLPGVYLVQTLLDGEIITEKFVVE